MRATGAVPGPAHLGVAPLPSLRTYPWVHLCPSKVHFLPLEHMYVLHYYIAGTPLKNGMHFPGEQTGHW